jgi:kynurenine formamidase
MKKFPYRIVDLSHPINSGSPCWDGGCGFKHTIYHDYTDTSDGVSFRILTFDMIASIGTHIDAPAHCFREGLSIDKLSLQQFLAPCVMIDLSKFLHESFVCQVDDVLNFEQIHGVIKKGSLVVFFTGWSRYWYEPEKYRNDLKFPSISEEVAALLLEREVVGIGIDTLSADTGLSLFPVHHLILGAGKYLIENIANAYLLPATGSYTLSLPLFIEGATESPTRMIGLIKND